MLPELTTGQKGAIAESAIVHEAIKLGIEVYKPLFEGGRYDLVFDLGVRMLRVQCKWAVRKGNVVIVRCYSCRRTRNGLVQRTYSADEIDGIAAYCDELDRCFFLPAERISGRSHVQLRLAPSRNNQKVGVNWADEFKLESLDYDGTKGP